MTLSTETYFGQFSNAATIYHQISSPLSKPYKSSRDTLAGNVHGMLTFCMTGTTIYRKRIPVSSFFVQRFCFNILWVSRLSSISLVPK